MRYTNQQRIARAAAAIAAYEEAYQQQTGEREETSPETIQNLLTDLYHWLDDYHGPDGVDNSEETLWEMVQTAHDNYVDEVDQ
jgi:hypothetical protein